MILGDYIRQIDTHNNSVYILHEIDFYLVTDRYCLQILQTSSAVYRARLSESHMNIYETFMKLSFAFTVCSKILI